MPNNFYYLISSLPRLEFGQAGPITGEEFLNECSKWLSQKDLLFLSSQDLKVNELTASGPFAAKVFNEFSNDLNQALSIRRRALKGEGALKQSALLDDIFDQKDPLSMELKILKIKWDLLDEARTDYHFDLNVLIVYFLKLQILERLAVFNKEKGRRVFKSLCEVTYDQK